MLSLKCGFFEKKSQKNCSTLADNVDFIQFG
jgi:hypothetical protein